MPVTGKTSKNFERAYFYPDKIINFGSWQQQNVQNTRQALSRIGKTTIKLNCEETLIT